MQDEGRSYPREGSFGGGSKEGVAYQESRVEKERKVEATGSRTEVARDKEEVEGRIGVKEERMRREA